MDIEATLSRLEAEGNTRRLPHDCSGSAVLDLSGNDYLGIAGREDLRRSFMDEAADRGYAMTAAASRLLASHQSEFEAFERTLADAYGRPALLFNSGYHANTGMISALSSDKRTLIVADRLVHASIIDGVRLGGAPMERFRHNDYNHLRRILEKKGREYPSVLIIAESIYSMDGDRADIDALVDAKRSLPGAMLYIDEAHAVGACGPHGLGLVEAAGRGADVDIVVGTLGKALAGTGAYGIMSERCKQFMVNKARSLIFSTAMPPICAAWNRFVFGHMMQMDAERAHLAALSRELYSILRLSSEPSHIAPFIAGNPRRAVELSRHLERHGFHVLPIRTPTVPPGTDRLRFSISAAMTAESLAPLRTLLANA
ncbi:MAG: 8-amino-7-oxononanoate synthase [Muribaculaceae bacterium]|nr:8-amino-7-oxononanoate synthase [Muribaculaceae bacterium]